MTWHEPSKRRRLPLPPIVRAGLRPIVQWYRRRRQHKDALEILTKLPARLASDATYEDYLVAQVVRSREMGFIVSGTDRVKTVAGLQWRIVH